MGSPEGNSESTSDDTKFTVAVFCGANPGKNPMFAQSAKDLAHVLHTQNWNLVYGGGTVGLMGTLSSTLVSLSGPSAVHGIIPHSLVSIERSRNTINSSSATREKSHGRLTIVKDMHARKSAMASGANAFVGLPGGFGTLEEVMEIITWNFLGIHAKPIVLFNVDGYYDDILRWVDKAVRNGFVDEKNANIVVSAASAEGVVERIKGYRVAEGRHDLDWESK